MVDAVGICLLLKGLQKDSSYFDLYSQSSYLKL